MFFFTRKVSCCNHESWSIIRKNGWILEIILLMKGSTTHSYTTIILQVIYCLTIGYKQCWNEKLSIILPYYSTYSFPIPHSSYFTFSIFHCYCHTFFLSAIQIHTDALKGEKMTDVFHGLTRREETVSTLDETNSFKIFSFPHIFHHTMCVYICNIAVI